MAYAESTVGGSLGGAYRVWVNSIRTYDGSPAENFEDWRAEGGLNKISTGGYAYNNYGNSSYTLQLGLNGVASSGNFSYTFNSATVGTVVAWGTTTSRVYRDSAGVGFGFQSRMDINLQNSPYLTSGWVTASDSVQTRYRHSSLTALSMDSGNIPATDEGPMWVEFSNPAGAAVDAFIEAPSPGFPRVYTSSSGVGSRFNFPNLAGGSLTTALQNAIPNSNTGTLRIGIHDSLGGDSWDYRERTYTIKNDAGQANPIFTNFTYRDTNAATVAVTGSDQVLIQGKSILETVVSVPNKATARKGATMSLYNTTIGATSVASAYSSSSSVIQTVGVVADVSGAQALSVRAVDSRFNGTTVTKNITVLPYSSPEFERQLNIVYTNAFDYQSGLTTTGNGSIIATISPMTLSGVDKNVLNTTTGVQFDMSKNNNTAYTGSWTNVITSRTNNSPNVTTDLSVLSASLLAKMASMGYDNSVKWYVKFKLTDSLETQYFEVQIDVGKAVFRIGADDKLYNKEKELLVLPMISTLADNKAAAVTSGTGTITPYTIGSLYVMYGTGVGNSSTVVFDVNFSFKLNSGGIPTIFNWAMKVDGTVVGNPSRKIYINQVNNHTVVNAKVISTGLSKGMHTIAIEVYGGGQTISTDSADFCTIVATEYANSSSPLSVSAYAGTVANGGGAGVAWSSPSNAQGAANGTVATVTEGQTPGPSQKLVSSSHGFSIPANATITGIKLEAMVYGNTQSYTINVGTTSKTSTSTPPQVGTWSGGGTLHWIEWGGQGDLWGRTDWAPVDINSTSFGGAISALSSSASSADQVDAIRLTVYYS